jgi:hypothetical protein
VSPRSGPRRHPIAIRLSDDELDRLDGWARTLGLANYRGEPNRSATIQWLTTQPVSDVIGGIVERDAQAQQNGEDQP